MESEKLYVDIVGAGQPVFFVHGSFGWGTQAFPKQRVLAYKNRLYFIDRRGFGRSPDSDQVDFETDKDDLIVLASEIGQRPHLVGHSYGAVPCLLAAQERPELFMSVTLVEPSAFGIVRGNPAVEEFIRRIKQTIADYSDAAPKDFLERFAMAMGYPSPKLPTPDAIGERSINASVHERRPWEAEIDLKALAGSGLQFLIVNGSWENAPQSAQEIAGESFFAVSREMASALPNCRWVKIDGAAHNPQMVAERFNSELMDFWSVAESG